MTEVLIFVRPGCPLCDKAKAGLDKAGVPYEVQSLDDPDAMANFMWFDGNSDELPIVMVVRDYELVKAWGQKEIGGAQSWLMACRGLAVMLRAEQKEVL